MPYLYDNTSESFSQAVDTFYGSDNSKFVWNFDNICDNEVKIEYPNILIRRCAFSYINEQLTVKWITPIDIKTSSTIEFVISFDKLLYDENYEYNFKNIIPNNGTSISVDGVLSLFSGDGSIVYTTATTTSTLDNLEINLYNRVGWFDLVFKFNVPELCDVEGFDYFADVKGSIYKYRKNNCNKNCCNHNNKIKVKYTSYLTITV